MIRTTVAVFLTLFGFNTFAADNTCAGCETLSGPVSVGIAFPGTAAAQQAVGFQTPKGFVKITGQSESDLEVLTGHEAECVGMFSHDRDAFWVFTMKDCVVQ